jgi:hypothetical protein
LGISASAVMLPMAKIEIVAVTDLIVGFIAVLP